MFCIKGPFLVFQVKFVGLMVVFINVKNNPSFSIFCIVIILFCLQRFLFSFFSSFVHYILFC